MIPPSLLQVRPQLLIPNYESPFVNGLLTWLPLVRSQGGSTIRDLIRPDRTFSFKDSSWGSFDAGFGSVPNFNATDNTPVFSTGSTTANPYFPNSANPWTVCCYAYATSLVNSGDICLFGQVISTNYFDFYTATSSGTTYLAAEIGSSNSLVTSFVFPVSTWVPIAATYNGSAFTLYANGQNLGSRSVTATLNNNAQILTIGSWQNSSAIWRGGITDFRLWNRCLTASEIQMLHYPENRWIMYNAPPYQKRYYSFYSNYVAYTSFLGAY